MKTDQPTGECANPGCLAIPHTHQPTVEWTVGQVFAYWETEDFQGICDLHNAALAAERGKHLPYISDLERQLAAERRRTEAEMDARHRRQLDEGIKQLAAGRNIVNERDQLAVAVEEWQQKYNDTQKQLAAYKQQAESMLATSKRVNDQLRSQVQTLVDAVQEALVALATLKITDTEKTYAEISPELRQQILKSHDLTMVALAKVKEEK